MIIAIDFDGTLHRFSKGWHDGSVYDPPVDGAVESVKALIDAGHTVIIHTCRFNVGAYEGDKRSQDERIEAVTDWMDKYGIRGHELWTEKGKPFADVYIDDKAICFTGNWAKTVERVKEFKPWIGAPPVLSFDAFGKLRSDKFVPGLSCSLPAGTPPSFYVGEVLTAEAAKALAKAFGCEFRE